MKIHGPMTLLVVSTCAALVTIGACADDSASSSGVDAGAVTDGGSARDAAKADAGGGLDPADAGEDSSPDAYCSTMRSYETACSRALTCGSGYDAWCVPNTKAVDSDAYRRGYVQCATTDRCKPADRKDCMYASYATASQTAAQKALVHAYCQTCEPSGVAACETRIVTYDTTAGPAAVEIGFIAAWELADSLCDKVRTQCTGAALDGGTTPSSCAKAFDDCAGGLYVDALVSCN